MLNFNMLDMLGKMDVSHVPPEFLKRIQGIFVGLFGGKEKFDCWMTKLADEMADPNNPSIQPIKIDTNVIPPELQSLMHKPHEIIDLLMETAESFELYDYSAKIKKLGNNGNFLAIAYDKETGHIIEEFEGLDDDLHNSLTSKYGDKLEIVKE